MVGKWNTSDEAMQTVNEGYKLNRKLFFLYRQNNIVFIKISTRIHQGKLTSSIGICSYWFGASFWLIERLCLSMEVFWGLCFWTINCISFLFQSNLCWLVLLVKHSASVSIYRKHKVALNSRKTILPSRETTQKLSLDNTFRDGFRNVI